MKRYSCFLTFALMIPLSIFSQSKNTIQVKDLGFTLNDKPFYYTGISFFNAIYNPTFNKSDESRRMWLTKLRSSGINVIRLWAQWDTQRGLIDTCPTCSLYDKDGGVRPQYVNTLKKIIAAADDLDMVILFVLFSRENWDDNMRLSNEASDRAVRTMAVELKPYRNVVFQIWNEFDHRTLDYMKIVKDIDPARLVTNSPGYGGYLGKYDENAALDYLSPHTTRRDDQQWEIAPKEVAYLLELFRKPVVDDEPARRGTPKFGGPKSPTTPYDHILRIYNVWRVGGHVIYHHDMFQTGYGSEAIPPSGIPDPEFSSYHKVVFDFLANKKRYLEAIKK